MRVFGIFLLSAARKGTPLKEFWSTSEVNSWPLIKRSPAFRANYYNTVRMYVSQAVNDNFILPAFRRQ